MKSHEIIGSIHVKRHTRSDVRHTLRELEAEGVITRIRGNRWAPARPREDLTGTIQVTSGGFGIVVADDADGTEMFVPRRHIEGAMSGDRVRLARLERRRGGGRGDGDKEEVRVTGILERKRKVAVGIAMLEKGNKYVLPNDPRIQQSIGISGFADDVGRIRSGDLVVVAFDPPPPSGERQTGRIVENLGDPEEPHVDMLAVLKDHNLATEFSSAAKRMADRVKPDILPEDLTGREDLRAMTIFTIDPEDAKDYDDAISLESRPAGWMLGVHIADVSHYVKRGNSVDKEARSRGNSVYMVDRFLPMLPKDLTQKVCSLRADEDKLAYTVWIELDKTGHVTGTSSTRSVIRSCACLSYDQVQALIEGKDTHGIHPSLVPTIHELDRLARRIRARRISSGAIELSVPEVTCKLDDEGNPVEIVRRRSPEAYHLIEECMLLANCAVAERIRSSGHPGIYRIHPEPTEEQWAQMAEDLAQVGLHEHPSSREDINQICEAAQDTPREYSVNIAMLRNFQRAMYSPGCAPHFGLAFDCYTHFTSPIRRYADLVTHRVLDALDQGKRPRYDRGELDDICFHCSSMEKEAEMAENESLQIKRLQYFQILLGRGEIGPFAGIILSINRRGLLIELTESLQRGFLPFAAIQGEYITADTEKGRAYGRNNRHMFSTGDVINVEITKVDMSRRQVDFHLPDAGSERERTRGKRKK